MIKVMSHDLHVVCVNGEWYKEALPAYQVTHISMVITDRAADQFRHFIRLITTHASASTSRKPSLTSYRSRVARSRWW
jgi:hypothetical protein